MLGEKFYYDVRDRFNGDPGSLDFIFLNRACFNGVIRFNRKGEFNVPWNHKPSRFSQAYITKVVNQFSRVRLLMIDRDWSFHVSDWRDTLSDCGSEDFVYADPPYIGRHIDYFNGWSEEDNAALLSRLRSLPCRFALSTWKANKYRTNPHLGSEIEGLSVLTTRHFYHVGPTEDLRNEMEEALVVSNGSAAR